MPKSHHSPQHLLALSHLLPSAFFKKTVQQKIKTKVTEMKQHPAPLHPALKTLVVNRETDAQMRKTKRKYEAYQEEMEKKRSRELEGVRERQPLSLNKRNIIEEPDNFRPILSQTHTLLRHSPHNAHPLATQSEHRNMGRKLCELDGSIFHFEGSSPVKPFFRNMFHTKELPAEQAEVYQLLKTTSPITIKTKMIAEALPAHSLPAHQPSPTHPSKVTVRQLAKAKVLSLHKRERSSLINLRVGSEEISGWEFTD